MAQLNGQMVIDGCTTGTAEPIENIKLKQFLFNHHLTQKQFADSIEVSQSTVRNWVQGQPVRDVRDVLAVCNAYDMGFYDVLTLLGHNIDKALFFSSFNVADSTSAAPQRGTKEYVDKINEILAWANEKAKVLGENE